jgi:hypothetical protein
MNLMGQMLKQLQDERDAIDEAIASIEAVLQKQNGSRSQQGRGAGKESKSKGYRKEASNADEAKPRTSHWARIRAGTDEQFFLIMAASLADSRQVLHAQDKPVRSRSARNWGRRRPMSTETLIASESMLPKGAKYFGANVGLRFIPDTIAGPALGPVKEGWDTIASLWNLPPLSFVPALRAYLWCAPCAVDLLEPAAPGRTPQASGPAGRK